MRKAFQVAQNVSEFVWSRLQEWGLKRVFGYPGDGVGGLDVALEKAKDTLEYVKVRHEEMAAFMASGHAKFTGEIGLCYATSGPGAIHLLNGLYDAKMDHVPVVAIVGKLIDRAVRIASTKRAVTCVTLDDEKDQYGLRISRITYSLTDNDNALIEHALGQMQQSLEAVDAKEIFRQEDDTCHLAGAPRMGSDRRMSVVDGDCRSWDISNPWVCDGSVVPINGGVNPSLTITSIAMRTVDRIVDPAARGEL
jgi:choline dehydrogenase-like flavoprotein